MATSSKASLTPQTGSYPNRATTNGLALTELLRFSVALHLTSFVLCIPSPSFPLSITNLSFHVAACITTPHRTAPKQHTPEMDLFIPFMFLLALFWLTIGLMIARYAQQNFKGKPWTSTTSESPNVFGNGIGHERPMGRTFGGDLGEGQGGRVFNAYERQKQAPVGLGNFGSGGVKGM
jgi:hypothetical protein